jgi:O-Antigen ligase
MSTAPLTRGHSTFSGGLEAARWRVRSSAAVAVVLGAGMLAVILYAAFAHGAVSRSEETRVEVAVAALAALGAFGWLWLGTIRLRMARIALAGVALLAALAIWSGLSVIWSVTPDQSWLELNRVLTYTLVVCLGAAIGVSLKRGIELLAGGFAVVSVLVAVYALGQKLFPGLHIPGVFTLDQTGPLARLQEPLGYWNALALFITLGAAPALALAVDTERTPRARVISALALQLMLTTVPFTYSRGGLGALAVALAIAVGLSADWLGSLSALVVAVVSSLPAILSGLLVHQLSGDNLALSTRDWAGGVLALVVLASLAAHVFMARRLIRVEARIRATEQRLPRLRRLALAGAAVIMVCTVIALSLAPRGLTGTVSELWHGFTTTHVTSNVNPSRLLSAASENRWVWWKEAAGAFSARPVLGWGAGSFPVVHLLYRQDTLPVQQPHSLPLQFLAETGIIGGVLGLGALTLLLLAGLRSVRARRSGRDRLLAAALLAAAAAYVVHCCYDWDWDIPGLSLPAFLFLGVLAAPVFGAGTARATELGPRRGAARSPGQVFRAMSLAAATLWLCAFTLSVLVPQIAADSGGAALVQASGTGVSDLQQAQANASLASRLDPLSDQALLVESSIASQRQQPLQALKFLRQAVARDPSDTTAWRLLALDEGGRGDLRAARMAYQQALNLDPMSPTARRMVYAQVRSAPPQRSPTRTPTALR